MNSRRMKTKPLLSCAEAAPAAIHAMVKPHALQNDGAFSAIPWKPASWILNLPVQNRSRIRIRRNSDVRPGNLDKTVAEIAGIPMWRPRTLDRILGEFG